MESGVNWALIFVLLAVVCAVGLIGYWKCYPSADKPIPQSPPVINTPDGRIWDLHKPAQITSLGDGKIAVSGYPTYYERVVKVSEIVPGESVNPNEPGSSIIYRKDKQPAPQFTH